MFPYIYFLIFSEARSQKSIFLTLFNCIIFIPKLYCSSDEGNTPSFATLSIAQFTQNYLHSLQLD
jgi:hypothetical protein